MENKIILPAEWYPQSAVQLTWPHDETDWAPILDEVIPCFVSIAKEVIKHEKLLIVCPDEQEVRRQWGDVDDSRIISGRWRRMIPGHVIMAALLYSTRENQSCMTLCSTGGG